MTLAEDEHVSRFDDVAHDYVGDVDRNLRLAGGDSKFFYEAKVRLIRSRTAKPPRAVLDFGCGVGVLTRMLADAFPEAAIVGFDPSTQEIKYARESAGRYGARLRFQSELDAASIQADVVVAAGVFHHIPPTQKAPAAARLAQALAPGGRLFVFEHNPFSPFTRIIVALAKVDRGATLVSARSMKRLAEGTGLVDGKISYISFFPPFLPAPLLGPLLKLEPHLESVPLSAQYMLTADKPSIR
jgi:2-polyprenyl-3-methyl-5-hydroxy-6-metoxy-1,4-benzoquinol methylase